MRLTQICSSAGVAVLVAGCNPASKSHQPSPAADVATSPSALTSPLNATSKGFPKRADGWWETSLGEAKQQYCVGGDSEEKYSLADALGVGDCTKRDFQRTATGWRFETVCSIMGHTATQSGTITGDLRTNYRIDQQVVSERLGTQKGELVGRRLGDCPAKYKPGDQVSGGMTLNLLP